jgi:hypothetical protein
MGAVTLLFWLGSYKEYHPEIKFLICEAPFDSFSSQKEYLAGTKKNSWR